MKRVKKLLIMLLIVGVMCGAGATSVYAVTPHMNTDWVPKIPEITWDSFSDETKEIINDIVKDAMDNDKLPSPEITQATYRHGVYFWDRTRLQVRWDEVIDADYYEVRITKTDGTSNVYETSNNSLFVYEGSDEFVTDCLRSGTVEVRSIDSDGLSGAWSKPETISCNSLFR